MEEGLPPFLRGRGQREGLTAEDGPKIYLFFTLGREGGELVAGDNEQKGKGIKRGRTRGIGEERKKAKCRPLFGGRRSRGTFDWRRETKGREF
jgi:hypothetical protein